MRRRRSSGPTYNTNVPVRSLLPPRVQVVRPRVRPVLRVIEDRRTFHPLREMRPVLTFSRRDQRRIVEKAKSVPRPYRDPFPSLRLGFAVPHKVAICVRRKQRREALFAFNRQGPGARARRRRTETSKLHC